MNEPNDVLARQYGFVEDLCDWLSERDLLSLVLEAVQLVEGPSNGLRSYRSLPPGPPRLSLTILTYSYAIGLYSSEEIERRVLTDRDLRYLAARSCPSGSDLRRFRRNHREKVQGALAALLRLAWEHHVAGDFPIDERWKELPPATAMMREFFDHEAEQRVTRAVFVDSMALDD